jgi:uncharacterized membrane protein YraQ (UPF0718 family)
VIVFGFTLLLMALCGWLIWLAHQRRDGSAKLGLRLAWRDFVDLIPRLAVGVIGSGFIARAVPQDVILAWLGPGSGISGVSLAALAGALTPGGPVVGFAIGAAALKAGAGLPQVMAFVTGWSLYTLQRVLVWELPTMPLRIVVLRVAVSLPFPFVVAGLAWMAG